MKSDEIGFQSEEKVKKPQSSLTMAGASQTTSGQKSLTTTATDGQVPANMSKQSSTQTPRAPIAVMPVEQDHPLMTPDAKAI